MAYNFSSKDGYICSLIDARNNQVYCGIFDNKYNLCEEYIADDINKVIQILYKYDNVTFVGDGAKYVGVVCADNHIHAKNVGIAGYGKYARGLKETADTILPLYLRPSQAERIRSHKISNLRH